MSIKSIRGNALDLPLEDNTVDLVVTSPPYFGLRSCSMRAPGLFAAVSARLGRFCGAVLLIAYALAVREERDARRSLHRAAMLRRLSGGVR